MYHEMGSTPGKSVTGQVPMRAGKIGLMVKHSNRLTSETVAWGYLIGEAIAGAVLLLLSAYWIFFRK
jgi:hypothetical protein